LEKLRCPDCPWFKSCRGRVAKYSKVCELKRKKESKPRKEKKIRRMIKEQVDRRKK